jgi:hypothetical protein
MFLFNKSFLRFCEEVDVRVQSNKDFDLKITIEQRALQNYKKTMLTSLNPVYY